MRHNSGHTFAIIFDALGIFIPANCLMTAFIAPRLLLSVRSTLGSFACEEYLRERLLSITDTKSVNNELLQKF